MMKPYYPLKHWGATLLLAPLLSPIYECVIPPDPHLMIRPLQAYPFVLFYAFFLSLPTLLVYFLAFYLLRKRHTAPLLTKLVLIVLTITGVTATMLIFDKALAPVMIFCFAAAATITGCVLKIKSRNI